MPITLRQFRTKFPTYNDLSDRKLLDNLRTKFYSDIPKQDFERRFVLGDKVIAKDVPPPKESITAQFKRFSRDPRPFEVKAGAAIEKSFRTNEVIAEMAARAAIHPFTKEGRRGERFKLSPEAIQAFRRQPDLTSANEATLNIIGTQGRFRQLAEEKLPRTREGVIDVLPLKIFGVPTAEIPREALKEITDFFGGFMTNPKQPLVITPVLSSILGLTKLGIIKVLRKVADRLKAKRAFNTTDAFKEIEAQVIKQGGKPQLKLLAQPRQPKLLPEFKSEVGALDIEKFKEAPVFFSKLQKTITQKMPVKATAEMVRNIAVKGAKAEEVKWSGIQDFLKDKKTVTKQEVLDFLKTNEVKVEETTLGEGQGFSVVDFDGNIQATFKTEQEAIIFRNKEFPDSDFPVKPTGVSTTKFHQYQIPGGENYKELLLRLPTETKEPLFKGHFDEPNVLSHVRHNERISSTGEKVLFIEEIQSDWAQKGRKEGFRASSEELSKLQKEFKDVGLKIARMKVDYVKENLAKFPISTTQKFRDAEVALVNTSSEFRKLVDRGLVLQRGININLKARVPEAPLLKNWHEFTLKRMLREAVNKGFDRLAWITGKQTAGRYNLAKQIDELQWVKKPNGNIDIIARKNEKTLATKANLTHSELETWVGKEITKRIEAGKDVGSLKGQELVVGGKWAFNLYDGIIPQFLNKFGKKFGARVEKVDIPIDRNKALLTFEERAKLEAKNIETITQQFQSIPITDAMKKVATEEGFELFAGVNPFKLLPEKFRTKVQEFFLPLSTLPQSEQLKFARSKTMGSVARAENFIIKTKKRIDKFPLDERIQMFKFLDGQISSFDLPADVRLMAKSIQQRQIQIGKALVRRGLLSQGAFDTLKGKYVHYIYARHILGNKADINPSQIITPSGKLDMSYLKSRNPNLTRNDRIALGLIEDAGQAIPTGMGKALTDMAKFDYLEKIAENPEWVWQPSIIKVGKKRWGIGKLITEVDAQAKVVAAQPDNVLARERFNDLSGLLEQAKAETGNIPKDFRQLPNTRNFGNLAGAFVRKPIFDDLMPLASSFSDSNRGASMKIALQIEQQGVGLFKIGKVPFNPPTVFRNIVSNFIQNNMRGRPWSLIPGDFVKAVSGIIKKEPMFIEAKRDGLFQTNFAVSELNEIFGTLNAINASNWSSFLAQVHKLAKYYGKIDDIAKYTIYRQLRHGGLIDLTVKPPSTREEALLEAQRWGMDYSLASRSIKEARRHILPLVTYQYKIAPLILESLQKRPWVIGKYMALLGVGGFGIAGEIARRKFDITPKRWAKMLKDLPQYIKRNATYAILPYKSPEGNWQWVNLEYYFPWGNWMSLFRDFKEGDYTQMLRSAGVSNPFLELLVAFKGTPIGRIPKDPFTGKNIYNELDSPAQQWLKIAEFMYLRWGPSFLSRYGAVGFTTAIGKKDKWGRTITPWQALGRWFGFNIISVSPRQTAAIKQARIREMKLELNRLLSNPSVSRPAKQKLIRKFRDKTQKIIAGTE